MKTNTTASAALVAVSLAFSLIIPTLALAAGPAAVNLGTAGNYAILTKTGVSTTGSTSVTGDIGLSPAAASYLTGFALTLPAAGAYSTSALVTGKLYASDYANPTPSALTTAVLDMQTAYTDAAGRAPNVTELGAGNIGGLTLAPGVYKWGTGVTVPTDVTLSGSANDVWILQIAQGLNVASGVHIVLAGGAQAQNVFWVVAGQTTIGTTASFKGNILDQTAIVLNTGASLEGRALAQTAVTLDSNAVTAPSGSSAAVTVAPPVPTTTTNTTTTSSSSSSASPSPTTTTVTTSVNTNTGANGMVSSPSTQVQTIGIDLRQGMRNGQVTFLQQFLISRSTGSAAGRLASAGATGYFGALTRAALAEYQANVGISPAIGNFGPITRMYLGSH
ncbi:MAG: hypothetical protein JWO84_514 [Parcubacteria group bacterium]|nr:hypothetical protein [Parcubacteria group bacterium]